MSMLPSVVLGFLVGFIVATFYFRAAIIQAAKELQDAKALNDESLQARQKVQREREVWAVERQEANRNIAVILTPIISILKDAAPESEDIGHLVKLQQKLMGESC